MSAALISRSPDLMRLREDGYEVDIVANHLVMRGVPYVNAECKVRMGCLVTDLSLAGDRTARPESHVVFFTGEHPCDAQGNKLSRIEHQSSRREIGEGLVIDHSFSSKPANGYADYYEKMTAYAAILSSHAEAIDPHVTARTFRTIANSDPDSPFEYLDTASTRAGIGSITSKLKLRKVGLIGVGGTGSYVLDQVAKTPVREIHIFDPDAYLQHNAYRSPGAPSIEQLAALPFKVDYWKSVYSRMHRGIIAHPVAVGQDNLNLLAGMEFVFLCLDAGAAKSAIIGRLERDGIPFIDVGMGVDLVDGSLLGIVRVTTSTPTMRAHVRDKHRIPLVGDGQENIYERNIQIADLNMLNAALAVLKWKKLYGFYRDEEGEHFSAFTIDGNHLLNEDAA